MFRFSIRDIIWLTLIVALGLTWYGQYRSQSAEIARVRKAHDEQLLTGRTEIQILRNRARAAELAFEEVLATHKVQQRREVERDIQQMKHDLDSRPKTYYLWPFPDR